MPACSGFAKLSPPTWGLWPRWTYRRGRRVVKGPTVMDFPRFGVKHHKAGQRPTGWCAGRAASPRRSSARRTGGCTSARLADHPPRPVLAVGVQCRAVAGMIPHSGEPARRFRHGPASCASTSTAASNRTLTAKTAGPHQARSPSAPSRRHYAGVPVRRVPDTYPRVPRSVRCGAGDLLLPVRWQVLAPVPCSGVWVRLRSWWYPGEGLTTAAWFWGGRGDGGRT